MAFKQETYEPGWACFQNGCHVSETEQETCPECGEDLHKVDELIVWRCECGGFTFANGARVNDHRSKQYYNPVGCDGCARPTGWYCDAP